MKMENNDDTENKQFIFTIYFQTFFAVGGDVNLFEIHRQ